jgi:hypothetical protein
VYKFTSPIVAKCVLKTKTFSSIFKNSIAHYNAGIVVYNLEVETIPLEHAARAPLYIIFSKDAGLQIFFKRSIFRKHNRVRKPVSNFFTGGAEPTVATFTTSYITCVLQSRIFFLKNIVNHLLNYIEFLFPICVSEWYLGRLYMC